MTIRVAAIDNHEIVRDGIASRLLTEGADLVLAASTASVEEFLDLDAAVDVILLDLGLESGMSTEWIPTLIDRGQVLLYTTEERPVPLRRAVQLGVSGVLLKSDSPRTMIAAIRSVADGDFCCSGPTAHALLTDETTVADLSARQVEILRALDEGLDYRQTAALLQTSEASVKTHLQRVREKFRKIGIEPGNAHHLTRLAAQQGHLD
jgi:DNA-binding NarL/FixJ family response regulator